MHGKGNINSSLVSTHMAYAWKEQHKFRPGFHAYGLCMERTTQIQAWFPRIRLMHGKSNINSGLVSTHASEAIDNYFFIKKTHSQNSECVLRFESYVESRSCRLLKKVLNPRIGRWVSCSQLFKSY